MTTQERIFELGTDGDSGVEIEVLGCEHDFVYESRLDIMDNGYGTEIAFESGLPMLASYTPESETECEEDDCAEVGDFFTVDYLTDAENDGVYYCGAHIDAVYVPACTEREHADDEEYDGVALLNITALRVTDAYEVSTEFAIRLTSLVRGEASDDETKDRRELQTAVLGLTSLLARNATLAG